MGKRTALAFFAVGWHCSTNTGTGSMDTISTDPNRLFIGLYPAGIVYADRKIEEHGDYRKVGFLPYDTLVFQPHKIADKGLLAEAMQHAATIQAKRGEKFQISTVGQYVILGE